MKKIDLHIHSYYSDGTMSPEEIIEISKNKNVRYIAITDHNELRGSKELLELAVNHNINVITGCEIDALDCGRNVHILAYGFNINDQLFNNFVERNRSYLEAVNEKLIDAMEKDNKNVSINDYESFNHDRTKGGWKALQYLQYKRFINELFEGFKLYQQYQIDYHLVPFLGVEAVCKKIHEAGGYAILAHPGKVFNIDNINEFKADIAKMIEYGIDGVECYYPAHSEQITNICLDLCKEHHLMITCGCDFHGSFQKNEIGQLDINLNQINIDKLLNK